MVVFGTIFAAIVVIICMVLLLMNLPAFGSNDISIILMAIAVIGTINILGFAVLSSKLYEIASKSDKRPSCDETCKCQNEDNEKK